MEVKKYIYCIFVTLNIYKNCFIAAWGCFLDGKQFLKSYFIGINCCKEMLARDTRMLKYDKGINK